MPGKRKGKRKGLGSAEMPLHQGTMERARVFLNWHSPSPCPSASNSPSSSESEKKQAMNDYYTRVPMKRGAAVCGDAEEDLELPQKRRRIARSTIPKKPLPKLSLPYGRDTLSDSEDRSASEIREEREGSERPSRPQDQEPGCSTQTPEELEDLEGGFRCMGCRQLFPTLELLKNHLEPGGEEAIAGLNFHLAFDELRQEREKMIRRQNSEINATSSDCQGRLFWFSVVYFVALLVVLFLIYQQANLTT
ncbi:protein FAM170A-like [Erethizon dorsatum]